MTDDWSKPDYLAHACYDKIDSISESESLRIYFREICSNWKPYVHDIEFEVDCYDKKKRKIYDEEYGYEFTICIRSKENPKNQKYVNIGLAFKYKNDRRYSYGLLPHDILNEIKSH